MTIPAPRLPATPDPDDLVWVFDLDNTLYPPACNLFAQIERNMQDYIQKLLHVPPDEARRIQKGYFRSHGTTLRGLMEEHHIDPNDFLDHVHVIDLSHIPVDDGLIQGLKALPGRKVIFTNGSTKHAENIIRHLRIEDFFEGIFDIVAAQFVPKPAMPPYHGMLDFFAIDPTRAVMAEDMPRNLEPAARLGMATVLVTGSHFVRPEDVVADYVHQSTDNLGLWLQGTAEYLTSSRPA